MFKIREPERFDKRYEKLKKEKINQEITNEERYGKPHGERSECQSTGQRSAQV